MLGAVGGAQRPGSDRVGRRLRALVFAGDGDSAAEFRERPVSEGRAGIPGFVVCERHQRRVLAVALKHYSGISGR